MKKIITTFAVIALGMTALAQEGIHVGLNVGLPTGDAADVTSLNLDLEGGYSTELIAGLNGGVTVGYLTYITDDIEFGGIKIETDNVNFLPISAHASYDLTDNIFVGANIGYALNLNEDGDNALMLRPKIGYKVNDNIGVSLNYLNLSNDGNNLNSFGAGISYKL